MKRILYENKLRIVDEEEKDHIHLDDGTVLKKNEIIRLPFGILVSKYSEKKIKKNIKKNAINLSRIFKKIINNL